MASTYSFWNSKEVQASPYASEAFHCACGKGNLEVCKLLFNQGEDISRVDNNGETCMSKACRNGHILVCQWLFESGATTDVTKVDKYGITPLFMACGNGHLSVCKWLFEVGAAGDITRENYLGYTPMLIACRQGNLSVCKWLAEVGAVGDITRANNSGTTPMFVACQHGHIQVCEWLFSMGIADDITKPKNDGTTPMQICCQLRRLHICQWLVFAGALNDSSDHIGCSVVVRDSLAKWKDDHGRSIILTWAKDVVRMHDIFSNIVLRASVLLPQSRQQPPHVGLDAECLLPRLPKGVLIRVGELLGVETGRRLRNLRELLDALNAILVEESLS